MGVIREKLNEVIGASQTTALLGEEAPRRPKPRREAPAAAPATMPTGPAFSRELREGTPGSSIPAGSAFVESLRKP